MLKNRTLIYKFLDLARDQMALGQKLDNNLVDLNEKIDREVAECRLHYYVDQRDG